MARNLEFGSSERSGIRTTPAELVLHLREAGAKRISLSRTDSFRNGVIAITATYPSTPAETAHGVDPETVREMVQGVFESIDDRLWFHGREWTLEWTVEPAFPDQRTDLIPLYDRRLEQQYGDGFHLWNVLFVYEERVESDADR